MFGALFVVQSLWRWRRIDFSRTPSSNSDDVEFVIAILQSVFLTLVLFFQFFCQLFIGILLAAKELRVWVTKLPTKNLHFRGAQ